MICYRCGGSAVVGVTINGKRVCVDCDCRPRDYHYTREDEAEMDDAALAHLDPEHGVNTGL